MLLDTKICLKHPSRPKTSHMALAFLQLDSECSEVPNVDLDSKLPGPKLDRTSMRCVWEIKRPHHGSDLAHLLRPTHDFWWGVLLLQGGASMDCRCSNMSNWIGVWRLWRPGWPTEAASHVLQFLSNFYSLAGCIVRPVGHCHEGILMLGSSLLCVENVWVHFIGQRSPHGCQDLGILSTTLLSGTSINIMHFISGFNVLAGV